MQAGSNCALPNLALLDKRAHVNKQFETQYRKLYTIAVFLQANESRKLR